MVEYRNALGIRSKFSESLCNKCATRDCTHPIIKVDMRCYGLKGKERLIANTNKPLRERTLKDYYCVILCDGVKNRK